jgi:hypothetical protein
MYVVSCESNVSRLETNRINGKKLAVAPVVETEADWKAGHRLEPWREMQFAMGVGEMARSPGKKKCRRKTKK